MGGTAGGGAAAGAADHERDRGQAAAAGTGWAWSPPRCWGPRASRLYSPTWLAVAGGGLERCGGDVADGDGDGI